MAKIPFNVSARTARLIGRENVAAPEGAVIELLKNAYDADSEFGIVDIDYSKNQMLIIDNGDGMTDKIIENHWMTIGTDLKEREYTSNKGRIKSGAKGIGRFALDKLGEMCTMITLPRGQRDGFIWDVDWRNFEKKNAKISEINADLNNIIGVNLKNEIKKMTSNTRLLNLLSKLDLSQGTIILIKNLRDDWNEDLSNKIFTNLEILNPPEDFDKFTINFFNSAFPREFGLIQAEPFKDYDYKLVATYEKNSAREVILEIHRNEFDYTLINKELFDQEDMKKFPFDKITFKKEHFLDKRTFYQLIPGFSKTEKNSISKNIGKFTFTFYFFKNTTTKEDQEKYKYKSFNSSTRKKWASKYGGIKLFRDNFRVRPYGEVDTASYDWLMLGDRVSISPASLNRKGQWRVNPNQVVGAIVFSRLSEQFLDDKSSREGLVENPTFDLFKNIITGIIRYIEDDRSTVGANLSEFFIKTNEEEIIKKEAEDIAENDSDEEESEEVVRKQNTKLKKGFKTQKRLLEEKEDELGMMRALASAGILIASFSHEFHHIKNKLNNRAFYLKKHLLELLPESKVKSLENRKNPYYLIDEISKLDEKIKQWVEFSITLTKKDRRKSKKFNLLEIFYQFRSNWLNHLKGRNIALNIVCDNLLKNKLFVKMIELDIDTIFDNLLANSIEAFQRDGFIGKREINIFLTREDEFIQVRYADSGPGLSKDIRKPEDIFKPFFTSKRDDSGNEIGTGLGMWLLKSAVDFNKGRVQILKPKTGFEIIIKLRASN